MSLRLLALALLFPTSALAVNPGGGLPTPADKNPKDGSLRIWGQIQGWGTVVDQDDDPVADPSTYGDPEHDPGFTAARARLGTNGMLPRGESKVVQASYSISVGVGSPYDRLSIDTTDVQIVDASGELLLDNDFGASSITFGIHRVPFSRGLLESSKDLVFQERSVVANHLGPTRDAGVTLAQNVNVGDDALIGVRLGAFNGNQNFIQDTDPGLLLAARAEFALGRSYQTFDPKLKPAFGIGANILNNNELATNTTRFGGDLLGRVKWFTLTGEYLMGTIAPGDSNAVAPPVSDAIHQSGLSAQLSAFIPVGEDGGPEIAVRFATFDDDSDSTDLGDVQILHGGFTWRSIVPHVDGGAGYIHRMEGGTRELANNTVRAWVQFRPTFKVL